jgi:hypothetical protein
MRLRAGPDPRAVGPVGAPSAWGSCDRPGPDVQCARIRVPLDWDRPNGRTIRLALARHLASKPDERIGTVFMKPRGAWAASSTSGAGPLRRRQLGSPRHQRQHPSEVLSRPAQRVALLGGRLDSRHQGGIGELWPLSEEASALN